MLCVCGLNQLQTENSHRNHICIDKMPRVFLKFPEIKCYKKHLHTYIVLDTIIKLEII